MRLPLLYLLNTLALLAVALLAFVALELAGARSTPLTAQQRCEADGGAWEVNVHAGFCTEREVSADSIR